MRRILQLVILFYVPLSFADDNSGGIGSLAGNLMTPVTVVAQFMDAASILIGVWCLLASFLRYMQYRKNKLASPISTVITLLVIGLILVFFPLVYRLTQSGIPFKY